jgi:AcrR family transcriptional regulator
MSLEHIKSLGRPLRADAERNRRRILAAAAEVFAVRGLQAGLDEIARHAGVGTGTVYRRFPDKAMLIEALFDSRIDAVIELAEAAHDTPDAWEGLVLFMEGAIEMQHADRGLTDLLFCDGCSSTRFAKKKDSLTPTVVALVERAKASGQLRADVTVTDLIVIQFMLHSVGMFALDVAPELWRRQLGLVLDGLRANPQAITPLPQIPLTIDELEAICMPGPGHPHPHPHSHPHSSAHPAEPLVAEGGAREG